MTNRLVCWVALLSVSPSLTNKTHWIRMGSFTRNLIISPSVQCGEGKPGSQMSCFVPGFLPNRLLLDVHRPLPAGLLSAVPDIVYFLSLTTVLPVSLPTLPRRPFTWPWSPSMRVWWRACWGPEPTPPPWTATAGQRCTSAVNTAGRTASPPYSPCRPPCPAWTPRPLKVP